MEKITFDEPHIQHTGNRTRALRASACHRLTHFGLLLLLVQINL